MLYLLFGFTWLDLMCFLPNTALEPTADSASGLSGSVGLAVRQFGGGSAFGR